MVRTLWPQTDARPAVEPEPRVLRLLLRNPEPLPPPYPLDVLHVHRPIGLARTGSDPAISVAPVLRGEREDVGGQRVFIGAPLRDLSLGRAMLPEHATGEPFRDPELLPDILDVSTAAGGLRSLPMPPHAGSASRASSRRPPSGDVHSLSPARSAASPGQSSIRQSACTTDSWSTASRRSTARLQPQTGLAIPEHRSEPECCPVRFAAPRASLEWPLSPVTLHTLLHRRRSAYRPFWSILTVP